MKYEIQQFRNNKHAKLKIKNKFFSLIIKFITPTTAINFQNKDNPRKQLLIKFEILLFSKRLLTSALK